VQEASPAAASDQKGDEVARRTMVQDLHHGHLNTQAAYRADQG
jgi:hypothetical protein